MTDADLIVLDIDGGMLLHDCLESIRMQTVAPSRTIVFDNGSRTPVSERASDVEIIRSETNLGFTGGVNAAYAETTAPYVALVNNDVVLDRDWLATVIEAMDADATLAAVQTIIRRDAQTIDGAGIDISDGTFRQIGHGLAIGTELPEAWGISATAALYRKSALGANIFDEKFFAYYEDVELSARLREGGWRLRVVPVVKATHRGSQSAARVDARRLRTRNRYRVARAHPGVGRVRSLLWEDIKLMMRGRSSWRGMWEGLWDRS